MHIALVVSSAKVGGRMILWRAKIKLKKYQKRNKIHLFYLFIFAKKRYFIERISK
jgi:hypothetical protein